MGIFAVDTSVLVAILKGEAEAGQFAEILSEGDWVIGWPNILEARIWSIRRLLPREPVLLNAMIADPAVKCVSFDKELEALAAQAYAKYGKGRHPAKLNYGDCMSYAVAVNHDVPLLFKGADFGLTDVKTHPDSVLLEQTQ